MSQTANEPVPTTPSFRLDGRVALVTGGASGIGAAIAAAFAENGARVAVVDRDADGARGQADAIGADAFGVACDVTDRGSVEAAVAQVVGDTGGVDILVNSAGVVALDPAEDLEASAWDMTLAVNLTGTFTVCQEVGRRMLAGDGGRIVNLASQAATVALDGHAAYCASKAGILGLTRVLASEWGPRGVRVNAISPTVVLTELGRKAWDGPKGEAMKELIPAGRFALPEEVAAAAVYLASPAADMVNGLDLVLDGGYTIR